MTGITYSFLAVFALALVTVALGNPPDGSFLLWSGYGVHANALAACVAVGGHLVLAALIYRLWRALPWGAERPRRAAPAPTTGSPEQRPYHEEPRPYGEPDVALIGLRGLTARAAERGDLESARALARRGLADKPGTAWLEELLDNPIAAPSNA